MFESEVAEMPAWYHHSPGDNAGKYDELKSQLIQENLRISLMWIVLFFQIRILEYYLFYLE
jgi:hypothetical protein